MKLTSDELTRGWVVFTCTEHGDLVCTTPTASVTCQCGKRAFASRDGTRLHRESLRRIKASQKSLQIEGSEITKSPVSSEIGQDDE